MKSSLSLAVLFALFAIPSGVASDEVGVPYAGKGEDPAGLRVMDLYIPEGQAGFPTVVWFHGGGLTEGVRAIPAELKGKGFAVVAPGYRLNPTVKAPAYIEDAAAAVAWVFENIGKYGGDPKKIVLSGHSAGAYLAAMVGLDKKYLAAHGIDANALAGLVLPSGNAVTHFTIRGERGIPPTRAVVDEYAPLYHVRADAPPILIITGDREKELFGRYEENAYFWRMLKLVGHPSAEIVELPGCDHGSMLPPSFPLVADFVHKHGDKEKSR